MDLVNVYDIVLVQQKLITFDDSNCLKMFNE